MTSDFRLVLPLIESSDLSDEDRKLVKAILWRDGATPVITRMSIRVSGVENGYRAGVEDAVIIPLVAAALRAKAILRGVLSILMRILDLSFPLLMQLIRFPLFTLRVLGDGIIAAVQGMLP